MMKDDDDEHHSFSRSVRFLVGVNRTQNIYRQTQRTCSGKCTYIRKNDDFYLLGHILPSLLACIAALGESYPVERNRFPWYPRTVPPLLVGGNHCVLRSGANWLGESLSPAQWLLVPRVLETLRGKCRAP